MFSSQILCRCHSGILRKERGVGILACEPPKRSESLVDNLREFSVKPVNILGKNHGSKHFRVFAEIFKSDDGSLTDASGWVEISYLRRHPYGFPL